MHVAQPQNGTPLPEVERGNEALPPAPSTEQRFEEQPQVRVERSAESVRVIHEAQPVVAPVSVQAKPETPMVPVVPAAPAAVQMETHPVETEPKNQ
jgi:hypothetical protein